MGAVTIFLCGDVMPGRGVDQILPHPSDPRLHEEHVKGAGQYVRLAEAANGPVHRPVGFSYIWGDALEELAHVAPKSPAPVRPPRRARSGAPGARPRS